MSSDLYVLDNSFYGPLSSPEMGSSSDAAELNNLFTDNYNFSSFDESSCIDFLQEISNTTNSSSSMYTHQNPVEESPSSIDQLLNNIIASCSSPPSHQLENLNLNYQTATHDLQNLPNGYQNFTALDGMEVKSEDSQVGFGYSCYRQPFLPHSYSGVENVAKYMQRSYSSNSCDGKPAFFLQSRFDPLMETPNFHNQALSSPENSFFSGQMRRVYSTGDLQNKITVNKTQRSLSSPSAPENSFMEESNFRVGRYSAEERKERILKYRAKRNQRNFNKTIKYACRKTLADNRPRIRGRFARNDEPIETPKASSSVRDDDEDDLWLDGLHEEEEEDERTVRRREEGGGGFVNRFSQHQFQYYNNYGYF